MPNLVFRVFWLVTAAVMGGCLSPSPVSPASVSADEDDLLAAHVAALRETVAGPPDAPRPQVLLLGTFHFANPGADAHVSKYTFDVFSPKGQAELAEVLDRLAGFRPTKILVERAAKYQDQVDEWYASYLQGKQAAVANEIVTVGFALAKRFGHAKVHGFDADGEWLATAPETREALAATAARLGKSDAVEGPVEKRYFAMYRQCDEIEETLTLRQRLRLMNHADSLRLGHGSYFFWSAFQVANGLEFPGPDGFASMWHNRNLRMFSNVQRLATDPDDRVLVIVGAGHVPILQHCVQSCPTMTWVPVDRYLRGGTETPRAAAAR